MSIILRDYQQELIDNTRIALRTHRRVMMQAPTGAGKTALAATMLGAAAKRDIYSFFTVHRQELIEQTIKTFDKVGIPYGVIAAGYAPNPFNPVQICSIDTLKHRIEKLPKKPGLIVIDEAHHTAAAGWQKIMDFYDQPKQVGLSATPERLDGKGLSDNFDYMVKGPSVEWLIDQGWLSPYRAFGSDPVDMKGVHTKFGDFVKSETVQLMNRPQITGDAVSHYIKISMGRRAIVFALNIEHSKNICKQFREAGIMAWHLDGETPKGERQQAIKAYRQGQITVLSNVGLFGEGFDLPEIECVIDLSPTQSLSSVCQRWGRSLRAVYQPGMPLDTADQRRAAIAAGPKPYAIMLDHAGNIGERHGFPDDDRDWSLEGRKKKSKSDAEATIRSKLCPSCYLMHRPMPACPKCGFVYESEGRTVKQVEGDLKELDRERMIQRKREEVASAKHVSDFVRIERERGYKPGWAEAQWEVRSGVKREEWPLDTWQAVGAARSYKPMWATKMYGYHLTKAMNKKA